MRYGPGSIAGATILAALAASSTVAQQDNHAPPPTASSEANLQLLQQRTTTAVSTPADGTAAVSTTFGAADNGALRRPNKAVEASPLTADECTTLGGEVVSDFAGVCASGAFCRTTDNTGAKHRVCLSKKQ